MREADPCGRAVWVTVESVPFTREPGRRGLRGLVLTTNDAACATFACGCEVGRYAGAGRTFVSDERRSFALKSRAGVHPRHRATPSRLRARHPCEERVQACALSRKR